jgi:hypothetical protein
MERSLHLTPHVSFLTKSVRTTSGTFCNNVDFRHGRRGVGDGRRAQKVARRHEVDVDWRGLPCLERQMTELVQGCVVV